MKPKTSRDIKWNLGYMIGFCLSFTIAGCLLFFAIYLPAQAAEYIFGQIAIAWSELSGAEYDMDF